MIAVWGASGFIGARMMKGNRIGVDHSSSVSRPGVPLADSISGVIWSAGWAGKKNIDDVEATPERSRLQNIWEPLELARRCQKQGKRLLIFSSGCLFDGLHPSGRGWTENDAPNFVHPVYHRDKWELEMRLREFGDAVTIFRFRLPFDGSHHPRNVTQKFSEWKCLMDVNQSFTWIPDLVRATECWEDGRINGGIWHVTQPGTLNNYFAARNHLNCGVGRIETSLRDYTGSICERSHAVLDSSKLQSVIPMTPVDEAWAEACSEWKSFQSFKCTPRACLLTC
jgi:dTDP-4-dehydrorhamnose reductase